MKNIKNIKFVTAFTKQFIITKKRGKWLGAVALSFFMVFLLSTCSQGATNKFKTEGEPTGLELDFLAYNVPNLSFDKGFYKDIGDEKFPVDEHGLLSSTQDAFGKYYVPENPALFVPHVTQNAGQSQVQTYNIGGFEYSAWLRLTDNTRVRAGGRVTAPGGLTNPITQSWNEPQGAIMAVPFVDANKKPLGSLMVAVFQDNAFPTQAEVPLGPSPSLCNNGSANDANAGKGLCKNVVLMMNFHEDPRTRAYVIATARVSEIGAQANSMAFDPQAGPNPQDREQVLKANGFHKISLQVGDDVPDQDLGDGSFHGPTLRVLVNDKEVIVYKNRGGTTPSHHLTKGWWDTHHNPGGLAAGDYSLSLSALNTTKSTNGNKAPYVGYFTGANRAAPYSNGAKEYNQAWKNLVGSNGNMANLATFGLAIQLGATGLKEKFKNNGQLVQNTIATNDTLSPQLAQIKITSYHEGDNSGVTVAIDQIPDNPADPIEIEGIGSVNLTATVTSTSSSDFSKAIRWESDDTNIAWVDTKGVVHSGSTAGTTKVKAIHIQTGASSEINISVKPVSVTGITLSQSSLNLAVNESQTVTVANVSPANANNKNVTWSTDNASVASVANGKVTGVADGTATITATAQDGSGITATVAVTVTTVTASSLSLSPSSIDVIAYYKTTKLTPQFSPANTTNKTIASWVSGDTNIATVDGSGNVTGIAAGSTTITATSTSGNHTATATVNVSVKDLNSVFFNDGNAADSGVAGTLVSFSHTYNFTFSPSDASVKTITCTKPTNLNFMTVTKDGNGCKFSTNSCNNNWQTLARVTATDVNGNVRTADITVTCKK